VDTAYSGGRCDRRNPTSDTFDVALDPEKDSPDPDCSTHFKDLLESKRSLRNFRGGIRDLRRLVLARRLSVIAEAKLRVRHERLRVKGRCLVRAWP